MNMEGERRAWQGGFIQSGLGVTHTKSSKGRLQVIESISHVTLSCEQQCLQSRVIMGDALRSTHLHPRTHAMVMTMMMHLIYKSITYNTVYPLLPAPPGGVCYIKISTRLSHQPLDSAPHRCVYVPP